MDLLCFDFFLGLIKVSSRSLVPRRFILYLPTSQKRSEFGICRLSGVEEYLRVFF